LEEVRGKNNIFVSFISFLKYKKIYNNIELLIKHCPEIREKDLINYS